MRAQGIVPAAKSQRKLHKRPKNLTVVSASFAQVQRSPVAGQ